MSNEVIIRSSRGKGRGGGKAGRGGRGAGRGGIGRGGGSNGKVAVGSGVDIVGGGNSGGRGGRRGAGRAPEDDSDDGAVETSANAPLRKMRSRKVKRVEDSDDELAPGEVCSGDSSMSSGGTMLTMNSYYTA